MGDIPAVVPVCTSPAPYVEEVPPNQRKPPMYNIPDEKAGSFRTYVPPIDPLDLIRDSIGILPIKGTLIVETQSLDMELDYLDLSVSKDSVIVVMSPQPFKARLKNMETVFVHVNGERLKCLCMLDPHALKRLSMMVLSFFRINEFLETPKTPEVAPAASAISELANLGTSE